MRKLTYLAVFEPSDDGYGVYFPDLPGCITWEIPFSPQKPPPKKPWGCICTGWKRMAKPFLRLRPRRSWTRRPLLALWSPR